MSNSLLFLPDISGFTQFVQSTEVSHSQHVIAELLEVLVAPIRKTYNSLKLRVMLCFFFKEEIPSQEKLLAQVETMFTAFYSHLKLMEKNRICPCNACASAVNLQLKIVSHSGNIEFLAVQGKRKPFGATVIEAHRLLKNSVKSDSYVLFSDAIVKEIALPDDYESKLFSFQKGSDTYDKKALGYTYSFINKEKLKLKPYSQAKKLSFDKKPDVLITKTFNTSAAQVLEYLTNYRYRTDWSEGVDRLEFNDNEVTRIGTEHACVINGKHLNFITVTKNAELGQLVYGEELLNPPLADALYQFYVLTPLTNDSCKLDFEIYWLTKSFFKKLALNIAGKHVFKKNSKKALDGLYNFVEVTKNNPL